MEPVDIGIQNGIKVAKENFVEVEIIKKVLDIIFTLLLEEKVHYKVVFVVLSIRIIEKDL